MSEVDSVNKKGKQMNNRGYTLTEIMVVVAIIGVVVLGVGGAFTYGCRAQSGQDQQAAEAGARRWAQDLDYEVKGLSCTRLDSDGDGYVSCTVRTDDGVQNVECAGSWTWNEGCRVPKVPVNNLQTQ